MERGVLVHRLLQSLPDIPRAARDEAARRHLARNGRIFSPEEHEAMLEQVRRVLDDPRFSELFSVGSRAEVLDRRPLDAGRPPHRGVRPGRPPRRDRTMPC